MAEAHPNRRLAAVMATDVVGYSKLMGADETGTLTALKAHREAVFDPAVAEHNGRIVKLMGDGTLVEFASAVDAVNCALAIQRAIRTGAPANASGIVLRIGINLGDVVIDGDDIYGDGVNVAARLEPLAEPGGVCIAAIVNESVGARVDVRFDDGGEVSVKNIDRPIRVWKWHPDSDPVAAMSAAKPAAANGQASIAVLPFDNMSGDPEQEYFSDGITEDIITDLSKVGGLMVIARNSTFVYKGKRVDVRAVGRELGVSSVLEGSIRRAANRVRITAQLIDAASGGHLWAERYDRDLTDIFELQDEVTRKIVEALKVTLTPGEQARLETEAGGTTNVEAHDHFLKGRQITKQRNTNKELVEQARAEYERAVELDPNYADAWAALGQVWGFVYNNSWSDDNDAAIRRADELATKAVALAPESGFANYVLSMAAGFSRDYERSKAAIDKALALKPNDAESINSRGAFLVFTGEPAKGIEDIERGMRLDPESRSWVLHFVGIAHLLLGNYETAAAHFRERILLYPETDLSRAMLASALGHLGEIDEARKVWAEMMAINPDYSFDVHINRLPFGDPADAAPIREGLEKAGLID